MASQVVNLVLTVCAFAGASANAAPSRVCELAATRVGLAKFASPVQTDKDGNGVLSVDFDADGVPDQLRWSVTGSASIVPPDNSTLELILTVSGKHFTLEQQRLHVIKLEAHYYVLSGWVESEQGPWHKEVFALGRKGISKICAFSGKGLAQ
jgi:hypothetical protein